jgi:hypothetical protein
MENVAYVVCHAMPDTGHVPSPSDDLALAERFAAAPGSSPSASIPARQAVPMRATALAKRARRASVRGNSLLGTLTVHRQISAEPC